MMRIEHNGTKFLVNKESHQAVSIVDLDDLPSLNGIQRLPGIKLSTDVNGSNLPVEEDEVGLWVEFLSDGEEVSADLAKWYLDTWLRSYTGEKK